MVAIYVVLALLFLGKAGKGAAFKAFAVEGGTAATGVGDYLMTSVMQGLQFGIAVAVILFGVRTILGELVPAFQGIAAKLVPGAVPMLDAPIVFPYAQNAAHATSSRPCRTTPSTTITTPGPPSCSTPNCTATPTP